MDLLTAHALFAMLPEADRGDVFPGEFVLQTARGKADCWPAVATGAVLLTGWLATLEPGELLDAARHGLALLNSGVRAQADLEQTTLTVLKTVMDFGALMEKHQWPQHALN